MKVVYYLVYCLTCVSITSLADYGDDEDDETAVPDNTETCVFSRTTGGLSDPVIDTFVAEGYHPVFNVSCGVEVKDPCGKPYLFHYAYADMDSTMANSKCTTEKIAVCYCKGKECNRNVTDMLYKWERTPVANQTLYECVLNFLREIVEDSTMQKSESTEQTDIAIATSSPLTHETMNERTTDKEKATVKKAGAINAVIEDSFRGEMGGFDKNGTDTADNSTKLQNITLYSSLSTCAKVISLAIILLILFYLMMLGSRTQENDQDIITKDEERWGKSINAEKNFETMKRVKCDNCVQTEKENACSIV